MLHVLDTNFLKHTKNYYTCIYKKWLWKNVENLFPSKFIDGYYQRIVIIPSWILVSPIFAAFDSKSSVKLAFKNDLAALIFWVDKIIMMYVCKKSISFPLIPEMKPWKEDNFWSIMADMKVYWWVCEMVMDCWNGEHDGNPSCIFIAEDVLLPTGRAKR